MKIELTKEYTKENGRKLPAGKVIGMVNEEARKLIASGGAKETTKAYTDMSAIKEPGAKPKNDK